MRKKPIRVISWYFDFDKILKIVSVRLCYPRSILFPSSLKSLLLLLRGLLLGMNYFVEKRLVSWHLICGWMYKSRARLKTVNLNISKAASVYKSEDKISARRWEHSTVHHSFSVPSAYIATVEKTQVGEIAVYVWEKSKFDDWSPKLCFHCLWHANWTVAASSIIATATCFYYRQILSEENILSKNGGASGWLLATHVASLHLLLKIAIALFNSVEEFKLLWRYNLPLFLRWHRHGDMLYLFVDWFWW